MDGELTVFHLTRDFDALPSTVRLEKVWYARRVRGFPSFTDDGNFVVGPSDGEELSSSVVCYGLEDLW